MKVLCSVFLCGLATCLSAGCGSDASVRPPGESVSGKITWEGQPLASGEVELTPSSGASATVPVLDGAYQTKAGVGVDAGATTLRISVHGAAMDAGGADGCSRVIDVYYAAFLRSVSSDGEFVSGSVV